MEGISESGIENPEVTDDKAFAVISGGFLRSIAWQKGSSGVAQVLQGPAPKQSMPAVGGETVIESRDEDIVVKLGGRAETVTCIMQAITRRKIVGHGVPVTKGLVQVARVTWVEHRLINPETLRIKELKLSGVPRNERAAHSHIAENPLAELRRRNYALRPLLFALASPFIVGKEKQAVLLNRPAHRCTKNITV